MIYHYTSVENFIKIIESKELYLFNAFNMNDNLEINWINHLIDEEFKSFHEKKLIEKTIKLYNLNKATPYLCCFSYDGDLLSQWRAYAEDGCGIAIGFDETKFNIGRKLPVTSSSSDLCTGLFDCIYDENVQKNMIHSSIELAINTRNAFNNDNEVATINLSNSLRMYSLVMKNPAFIEEKEIRLIHLPLILQHNKTYEIKMAGNISSIYFMKNKNGFSSFFKYSFESIFNDKLIPEIILGPKCNINLYDLDLFLNTNNLFNTKIIRSRASYR